MVKNKRKEKTNNTFHKTIEEPDFTVTSSNKKNTQTAEKDDEKKVLSAADKKLLKQLEKEAEHAKLLEDLKKHEESKKKKETSERKKKSKGSELASGSHKSLSSCNNSSQPETPRKLSETSKTVEHFEFTTKYKTEKENDDNLKTYQQFMAEVNKNFYHGKVTEIKGDLFTAPEFYSLAHCVAADFCMGAGIAKLFRAKFKRVGYLLSQEQEPGGLAILQDNDRFIYYLVTKKYSSGKPTYLDFWKSLQMLKNHMHKHQVKYLAIPQIGCGLDLLKWNLVRQMLEYIFQDLDVKINVYILEENEIATSAPQSQPLLRKCYVQHVVKPLIEIESGTGLIYFGTADGKITEQIENISKRFKIISDYESFNKRIGDVIRSVDREECIYGLIIRNTVNDRIDFEIIEKCLFKLKTFIKKDKHNYVSFEGFVEMNDGLITEKIITLMKYILMDVEIWICWPAHLSNLCPQLNVY